MIETKMPDVISVFTTHDADYIAFKEFDPIGTSYYRAEPVESLLKQAREVVAIYNDEYKGYDDLITAIDAFLGEGK